MPDDSIRRHIAALAADARAAHAAQLLAGACWPGGPADRAEPAALHWLRRWRPARAAVPLRLCSCAGGRCAVCN